MTETVVWPQMAFEFASVDDSRRLDIFNIGTKEIFQMFKGRSHGNDLAKSLATDSIGANVMVADASLTIVYMNRAVTEFLTEAESDIQKDLPRFKVATLIGSNIDVFHKNPAHQRRMLENLNATHRAMIHVGGRSFDLVATPLKNKHGQRAGVVVEWADATIRLQNLEQAAQAEAVSRAQAVIEFNMDGTIVTANENFLNALGYSLPEIRGKHHSMFVDQATRDSAVYREFWAKLNRGQFDSGEYKRIGKGGKEIWIQASYNPILDLNGKPFKVVKYATDTTAQVIARMRSEKVRGMMDQVASGTEELNASVREISEAMTKSKETAATAVDRVEAADQQAQRLSAAAEQMSSIVELIGNITGQINLLALNATIESARAGEAGRGFAVVASEVKNLANQAKQATDKIGQEIGNLNGISGDVVAALNSIKKAIQDVSEYVTSTAAAVEEQSAVTGEMSTSMQRAAAEAAAIGNVA